MFGLMLALQMLVFFPRVLCFSCEIGEISVSNTARTRSNWSSLAFSHSSFGMAISLILHIPVLLFEAQLLIHLVSLAPVVPGCCGPGSARAPLGCKKVHRSLQLLREDQDGVTPLQNGAIETKGCVETATALSKACLSSLRS